MDRSNWQKALNYIKERQNFVLATHENPDGDALGATLGLNLILRKLGKNSLVLLDEETIPRSYRFLPGLKNTKLKIDDLSNYIFVALECPHRERLGQFEQFAKKAEEVINIDHHLDNTHFGNINLVDPEAAAVCELIYDLAADLDIKLDHDIAICLYTGIVTDTGRFQYRNTIPKIFEMAKNLLSFDLDPYSIFRNIYETQTLNSLKLLSLMFSRARISKETKVISSYLKEEDFLATEVRISDTENFIDQLRVVECIEVALLIKEIGKGEVKASLRSTGRVNVAKIARGFGGGGHRLAAGFTSNLSIPKVISLVEEAVLKELRVFEREVATREVNKDD